MNNKLAAVFLLLLMVGCGPAATLAEPTEEMTDEPVEETATLEPTDSPTVTPTLEAPAPTETALPTTAEPTVEASAEISDENCLENPRLVAGQYARVLAENGVPNNFRAEADPNSEVLAKIPAGDLFFVRSGPVCNGLTYWAVSYANTHGWTAEGEGSTYWVEPYNIDPVELQTFEAAAGESLNLSYENLSFSYPGQPDAPLKATLYSVPSIPHSGDSLFFAYWEIMPAHKYIVIDKIGIVMIFKTNELEQHYRALGDVVSEVRTLLTTRGDINTLSAAIPLSSGGLFLKARPRYLSFRNGTGLSLIMDFHQGMNVIDDAEYRFQAITDDGQYFIAAIFRVDAPFFDTDERFDTAWEGYIADPDSYALYLEQNISLIEAASPADFTPNLDVIEAFLASIEVR